MRISQSINQSINQLINQSINQSISQSINQLTGLTGLLRNVSVYAAHIQITKISNIIVNH